MKARLVTSIALVAALVAVSTAAARTESPTRASASKITVWLQVDAQSGWPELVASTNAAFQKAHAGVSVDVQYQTWPDHLGKFDATLAGGNVPDVIEMGNTEMTKYMAAGAFANLSPDKGSFANSRAWLQGLAASATYNGKLYGVPYYAGSRVVTYRTDLYKKIKAKAPKSLAQFTSIAKKLRARNGKKSFSPVYIAGTDSYFAMSFVYDYGGTVATTRKGKWVGTLDTNRAIGGLTAFKNFFNATSRASKTTDETHPNPYDVYARGGAASMVGQSWFTCCVGAKYKTSTAQFVMPGHVKGQALPGFVGGSDLAVPVNSPNKAP